MTRIFTYRFKLDASNVAQAGDTGGIRGIPFALLSWALGGTLLHIFLLLILALPALADDVDDDIREGMKKREWNLVFHALERAKPEQKADFAVKHGDAMLAHASQALERPAPEFLIFTILQHVEAPKFEAFLERVQWRTRPRYLQSYLLAGYRGRPTMPAEIQRFLANRLMPMTVPVTSFDAWTLKTIGKIDDPEAIQKIKELTYSKLTSDLEIDPYFLEHGANADSKKFFREKTTDVWHELQPARNSGAEALARTDLPMSEKAAAFHHIFHGNYPHAVKYRAATSFAGSGVYTPELAESLMQIEFMDDGKRKHFVQELMELARIYHTRNPSTEIWVAKALEDPDQTVRQKAVILLNEWGKVENPRAQEILVESYSRLNGYPRNAAATVLGAANLLPSPAPRSLPPVPALPGEEVHGPFRPLRNSPTFHALLEDTLDELKEPRAYEFTPEERGILGGVQAKLRASNDPKRFDDLSRISWGSLELPKRSERSKVRTIPVGIANPFPLDAPGHSMADLQGYLDANLGHRFNVLGAAGELKVVVFAGELDSLAAHADLRPETTIRVPSPYSKLGIERFLVEKPGEKPTLYMLIPPVPEYAEHHAIMLKAAGIKNAVTLYAPEDAGRRTAQITASAHALYDKLPTKPDVLDLGYAPLWKNEIQGSHYWKLVKSESFEVDVGFPLKGELFTVKSTMTGNQKVILVVSSERSLWGTGSADLVEALVKRSEGGIKTALHLGSGGGPGMRHQYVVTVPARFRDRVGSTIPVENTLYLSDKEGGLGRAVPYRVDGQWQEALNVSSHGHSVSPAEQTRTFVQIAYNLPLVNIDTVDVESSLIAERIAEHNKATGQNVAFGAVHVITDVPAGSSSTLLTEYNLNKVDRARKTEAKRGSVTLALNMLAVRQYPEGCKKIYRESLGSISSGNPVVDSMFFPD